MNCVNACKKLVEEVFGSDSTQYQCIPSYVQELNKGGHKATCEVADGVFWRLTIAYREDLKSSIQYSDRGLSVDGTFLKTTVSGTLLVACFRNGNNELQVVGVAIVSIKNQTNWGFFLCFLMSNLEVPPAFMISNRDKGLVPAVMALGPLPRHFFCFRHLMKNFDHKFKSKVMKNAAWARVMSKTESEFESGARSLAPDANNNVESINGALRGIRKLPMLDCLMAIERYVGSKWAVCGVKAKGWGLLTHRASNRVTGYLSASDNIQVTQYSESVFIVLVKAKRGEPRVEYAVRLTETQAVCTCGFEQDVKAPCAHSPVCLRHIGKEREIHRFFDDSRKTSTYVAAYTQESAEMMTPPVLKSTLTVSECSPPKITKRRGRSRKHQRRESQAATLALGATAAKRFRCLTCGEKGHNKRSHKCKDSKT